MTGSGRRTGGLALWLAVEAPGALRALRLDAPRLQDLASRRLAWTLGRAWRTPFGRERLRRAGLDTRALLEAGELDPGAVLRSLRPVSKAELREAGDAALEDGRPQPHWLSSRSSGSTGEPFRVYYDARAWALLKHLVKLRARVVCGVRPWHRVAVVDALPLHAGRDGSPAGSGSARRGTWRRALRLNALDDPRGAAADLAAFRPHAVYGLPSALLEIAAALEAPLAPPPLRVFTSGELLDPGTRRSLQTAFGAPVLDVYGSSETKEIAWECTLGGMHVNADVVRVEVLDPSGGALPTGSEGEIFATLLVTRAMPLLRYRTGDRGALLPEPCPCGLRLPLLGVLTGREAEVLELAEGRRLTPYALTCALERVPGMLRYQVVQLEPSLLSVRARVRPEARASVGPVIREAVRRAAGPGVAVEVSFVEAFERGPGGKFSVVLPARRRPELSSTPPSEEAS